MAPSRLELRFIHALVAAGLPTPVREYMFAKPREWRADFAWPQFNPPVLVECEGGVWARGRHTRGKGFIEDCIKYNTASLMGFVILRFTEEHIKSGYAIETLRKALEL